jgi:phosphoribosylamine--glycine ligase
MTASMPLSRHIYYGEQQMKNILLIGSGAREHAIAKALKKSPQKPHIYCCGTSRNPGIVQLTQQYFVANICDVEEILQIARDCKIDLAIIGPEAPLERGLADLLWQHHIPTIGPKKNLAQLETSKSFTRNLLKKYNIPGSPKYGVFHDLHSAKDFLMELGEGNYVIKADGLMGGKGVKVAGDHLHSIQEAFQFCEELHSQCQQFVIEEKLIGQEFSLLCFCDGKNIIAMPAVQDHKRAFVGDLGPNTGGMGSYSDANHLLPFLIKNDIQDAQAINFQVINAITQEYQEKYIGILYGSFMLTKHGVRLIEYNARFGDPEAMNVLAILESDFVKICEAMTTEKLTSDLVQFSHLATVCKYAVPQGYPDKPERNFLVDVSKVQNPDQLYFAAVDKHEGKLYATGSRTVAVVGVAPTIFEAEKLVELEIQRVQGKLFHREDIGTEELIRKRVQHVRSLAEA